MKRLSDKNVTYKTLFVSLAMLVLLLAIVLLGNNLHPRINSSELEKISAEIDADIEAQHKQNSINLIGGTTGFEKTQLANKADTESITDLMKASRTSEDSRLLDAAGLRGQIAILLSTIIDFPSLIVILAAIWVRNFWKLILVAFAASLIGEIALSFTKATYGTLEILPYRLMGQMLIAGLTYCCVLKFRRNKLKFF